MERSLWARRSPARGRSAHIEVPGREPRPGGQGFETTLAVVSPDYPRTLGIRLLRGRELRPDDGPGSPPVALVSEALAERFWSVEDAVGRRFRFGQTEVEIVGVLADVAEGLDGTPGVTFYLPHAQRPDDDMNLFVRTAPGAASAAAGVRAALRELDPDLPTVEPQPVGDFLLLSLLPQRVAGTVGGGLGAAGLLLAALGVHGLVAFSIVQRRREIAIRMAVGADRRAVLALVFGDTLRLAAWGVGSGLLIAAAAGRLIESFLIGVSPAAPLPFAVAALAVVAFAAIATLAPARRAASLDPRVAAAGE